MKPTSGPGTLAAFGTHFWTTIPPNFNLAIERPRSEIGSKPHVVRNIAAILRLPLLVSQPDILISYHTVASRINQTIL